MKKLQSSLLLCLVGWAFTTQTTVIQAVESQSVGSITQEIADLYKQEVEELEQHKQGLVSEAEQRLTSLKTNEEKVKDWLTRSWDGLDTSLKDFLTGHTFITIGDVPHYTKQLWESNLSKANSTTKGNFNLIIYLDDEGNLTEQALNDLLELLITADDVYLIGEPSDETQKLLGSFKFITQLDEITTQDESNKQTDELQLLVELDDLNTKYKDTLTTIKEQYDSKQFIQTTITLPRNTIEASFATYPTNPSTSRINYWYDDPAYASIIGRGHYGMDIVYMDASIKDIFSVEDGVVEEVVSNCAVGSRDCGGGWGNYVRIKHRNGLSSLYAHLSQTHVKVGDSVQAGQVIAYMGTTGRSDGVHLHFELLEGSTKVNPTPYFDWTGYATLN